MKKIEFFFKNSETKSAYPGEKLGRTKTKDFQYGLWKYLQRC